MFNRIFWGIALIGVGLFFILDQRGIITFDIGSIIRTYWPLILIYFGLRGLIFQYRWGHGIGFGYLYPIILTTLGVYFLGRNIDYIHMSAGDFFQYIIPFILILIGVIIILRPSRKREHRNSAHTFDEAGRPQERRMDQEDGTFHDADDWTTQGAADPHHSEFVKKIDGHDAASHGYEPEYYEGTQQTEQASKAENHFSFIGDIHIGSANWELQPMNISHFIGDTVIDLTRASIPDGLTKISVGAFIGDVKVLLPADEDVEASVTMASFIGEFDVFGRREEGFMKNHRDESPRYPFARKKIQIMVNTFIGDFRMERI